jgi:hypothetical protein
MKSRAKTRSRNILRFYFQHRGDICSKGPRSVYLALHSISATSARENLAVSSLPRAAGKPPRANALWGLTYAYPPVGQGMLQQRYIARRKSVFLFQGVYVYFRSLNRLLFSSMLITLVMSQPLSLYRRFFKSSIESPG